ncbi:MAG: Hsp20/alpha crystallin family protein [Bacteroidetes bacterium]|nr:Hsp20/alpha crystallin family protein [Bacteroidota bacterium]
MYNRPGFVNWFDPYFEKEHKCADNSRCGCEPAANIQENSDSFIIDLAVPGMKKEDFSIRLEKDTLIISSEKETKTDESVIYSRQEFTTGSFSRSFILPKTIETEKIEAGYEQGILSVTLPKREESKVALNRQISVN